jgi:hypothetical protein
MCDLLYCSAVDSRRAALLRWVGQLRLAVPDPGQGGRPASQELRLPRTGRRQDMGRLLDPR